MLTLYYAPHTRASRIARLIDELDAFAQIDIRKVAFTHQDGKTSDGIANPHPEGKVPLLIHDGVEIWESNAIILYLTDLFPKAGMGPAVDDPLRGRYLSWLAWYGNVVEPVLVFGAAEISHPLLDLTFRGMPEIVSRLSRALDEAPFLMGERFTAADLLLVSPFTWFPEVAREHPDLQSWIDRCEARESAGRLVEYDLAQLGNGS